MFSKGQIIFAICFFVAFVIGISFAYTKDKKINKELFRGSNRVLFFILLVFIVLFGLVKIKHFFFR